MQVKAASINDWDWALFQGIPFINRLLYGLFKPARRIPGSDVAGSVVSVGKGVTRFKVGDDVYGDLSGKWGGFAEYVFADENSLAPKPENMSFEEAASIPQAAMLAVQGLLDVGQIKSGQSLLINGAGGGVGTFAIQIARTYGIEITAVDHTSKLDFLRSMGADHVIDYTKEDFTKSTKGYDIILDVKTDRSLFNYLRVLNPNGKYVTVGGFMNRLFQLFIFGKLFTLFSKKQLLIVALKPNKDLYYMNQMYESGKIKPIIDSTFELKETAKAFTRFGRAEHIGKIVISIGNGFV